MKNILTITTILLSASICSADLVHQWSFNGSGLDSIGGANATLVGGASIVNDQLDMNGSGQYAILPIDSTLSGLNSFTIETWATYDALTPWQRIFDFGNENANSFPTSGYLALTGTPDYGNGATPFGQFTMTSTTNAASENLYAGTIPGPDTPLHIAVVVDHLAQTGSFYLDGNLLLSGTISLTPSGIMQNDGMEHNWLGRSRFTQDSYMNGSIDEFRIYNHALSSAAVQSNFQQGPNGIPEPASMLILAIAGISMVTYRHRN